MKKKRVKQGIYQRVVKLLQANRLRVTNAVNSTMVYTYYEIGRIIVEEQQQGTHRAGYGKATLKKLSTQLTQEFGKGFSVQNLERMRQFYLLYSETAQTLTEESEGTKSSTVLRISETTQNPQKVFALSWSHYMVLMRIDNANERNFYEIESVNNNWSLRELQRQFDSSLYERLTLSKDKEAVRLMAQKGQLIEKPLDLIKDPYILEFLGLPEQIEYSENTLEHQLIDNLQHFLLELGKGFMFVGRQVRFTFDEEHFRVDLVFYNRILRCFVLIDLKIGKLKHQDLGQMQMYINYYDRRVKLDDENPTIGIVLCKDKKDAVVEMTLPVDNAQIFASRYQTVLPSKEAFMKVMEQ